MRLGVERAWERGQEWKESQCFPAAWIPPPPPPSSAPAVCNPAASCEGRAGGGATGETGTAHHQERFQQLQTVSWPLAIIP